MIHRRRFTPSLTAFENRLEQEAFNLRKQAEGMPLSIRRDELLRKANQAETAAQISEWLRVSGSRPPQ
jgi:hypothetical protein